MRNHANRKNIQTVDIYKDTYRMYKLFADENRYEAKALINTLLKKVLESELKFQEKYPNLSVAEVIGNHITLIEEDKTTRDRKLIDVYYNNDYELTCDKDQSTSCKHVHYAKNTEISNILKVKGEGQQALDRGKFRDKRYKLGAMLASKGLVVIPLIATVAFGAKMGLMQAIYNPNIPYDLAVAFGIIPH